MKRIVREALSKETMDYLDAKTNLVKKKRTLLTRKARAEELWRNAGKSAAFREIRIKLKKMANGLARCMYCEDSQGDAIDHFWPRSRYPEQSFEWDNYLLACAHCNSNRKRDQFPVDSAGRPLLIDPTRDDPSAHLVLAPNTGQFAERRGSTKAGPTIDVFALNARPELTEGRKNAFVTLQALIIQYADLRRRKRKHDAAELQKAIRQHVFGSVLEHLVQIAKGPGATLLQAECVNALRAYPEIMKWP